MLTQTEIAQGLSLHQSQVSKMLTDDPEKRIKPSYKLCVRITELLEGKVEEWREETPENLRAALELLVENTNKNKLLRG